MRNAHWALLWATLLVLGGNARGELTEEHVLILTNGSSEVSAYVARMYQSYYPGISEEQVLALPGLPDCGGPSATVADEIITFAQYESLIAQPVRDHLIATGLVDDIFCIITTAGMPYRIEDVDPQLGGVIRPAGSDAGLVGQNYVQVSAASVESQLAVLWQADPALVTWPDGPGLPLTNRMVNPYQGYRSSITCWDDERDMLGRRDQFRWTTPWRVGLPVMEGLYDPDGVSALDRRMSPADIYLVARLDGPRLLGQLPIFSVRRMLERAARVSNPDHLRFVGYSPSSSVVVFDHSPGAPGGNLVYNRVLNYPAWWDFGDGPEPLWSVSYDDFEIPPTSELFTLNEADDYQRAFFLLTGIQPTENQLTVASGGWGLGCTAYYDHTGTIMNQGEVAEGVSLFALATFGKNAGDGRGRHYLETGGPQGGPLFDMALGAVFISAESFNAVTMFLDDPPNTYQGRIVQFIQVGGTGAVGHVFEPLAPAVIDSDYLFRSLLRDDDDDGVGDLAFAEAAFTAMPFLSWAEVVIGDPLMRLRTGPGARVNLAETGDFNGDGIVNSADSVEILARWPSAFGDDVYDDRADFSKDGIIDETDWLIHLGVFNTNWDDPDAAREAQSGPSERGGENCGESGN